MTLVRSVEKALTTLERWLIVALLSFMIGMSFLQVVLRQGFQTGILWGDILLRHFVLWVGFLGAGTAAAQDKHFVIDAARKLFPGRWKFLAAFLCDFFALFCLWLLCGATFRFFQDDRQYGSALFTVGTLDVPSWWLNLAIPGGFCLLFIHYLLKAVEHLLQFVHPEEPGESAE